MLILMIPFLISIIVYILAGNTIKTEILRANKSLMDQIKLDTDNKINTIEQIAAQIDMDSDFRSLARVKGSYSPENRIDIMEKTKMLALLRLVNDFADQIFIYFKNTGTIVTPDAYLDEKLYYKIWHSTDDMPYERWEKLLNARHTRDFIPMRTLDRTGAESKMAAFVQSLHVNGSQNFDANLVIMIDPANFLKIIQSIQWIEGGSLLILDKDNRIMAASNMTELPASINYTNLNLSNTLYYDRINGEKVVISHTDSSNSGLKYISIIPERIFWEKAEYIRNVTFVGMLLFVLTGVLAAYLLTHRNYNPVNRIIQAIAENAGIDYSAECNEFRFIKETLDATINEKKSITSKLEQQSNILYDHFLYKLLKGAVDKADITSDLLSSYGIRFSTDHFTVILYYIEDYEELFKDEDSLNPAGRLRLVQFIITNVMEELISQENKAYMVEMDDRVLACIVNTGAEDLENVKGNLLEVVRKGQDFIQEKFNIYSSISLSDIHHTVLGISQAYREALDAMEYRVILGSGGVIRYEDIKSPKGNVYTYPVEAEYKLINCIKEGNAQSAGEIVEDILGANLSGSSLSAEAGKCLLFDLTGTILKVATQVCSEPFLNDLQPMVNRLLKSGTIPEMKNKMNRVLALLCEHVSSQQIRQTGSVLCADILRYVQEKFYDVNLNVTSVGEHFDRTPHYLSKLVKQQTGIGLHEYIDKLRIEKAKELILLDGLTINETAERVGYVNSNVFIRSFKKLEGVTPGKYKGMEKKRIQVEQTLEIQL